jgi:phosphinothricin acetyltransferase
MATTIRFATPKDARAIREIYAPFCEGTPVSFETQPPSVAEIRRRITKTLKALPWLVSEQAGKVVGYAYASRHRERAGYRWSVDVSVYVRAGYRGRGIGRALYSSLFAILELQGFRNIVAGISLPNPASVALHESMGMQKIGVYPGIGFKCGRWHDVGWWQLASGAREGEPEEPRELPTVRDLPECEAALATVPILLTRKQRSNLEDDLRNPPKPEKADSEL